MINGLSNKAQSSTDGHSIYDMIRANLLHGYEGIFYLLILQLIVFILCIAIKNKNISKSSQKLIYIFSIIIPIFYFIFKIIGLDNILVLSLVLKPIYARTYTIIRAITLIVAFLGVYTLCLALKINADDQERKFIFITISLMTLAILIGSNNYFYLFINNMFFQFAIVIVVLGEILVKNYEGNYENLIILEKANIIFTVTYITFMILMYVVNYSYRDIPRVYEATINNKKLKGMYTTEERSLAINDILNNIPLNIKEGTKIITHGNIPIFSTLLDMPPFFKGCNGWSDLSGLNTEIVIQSLKESEITEEYPLIIISKPKENAEINKDEKLNYIYKYIDNNNYEKIYENNYFIIYYFE